MVDSRWKGPLRLAGVVASLGAGAIAGSAWGTTAGVEAGPPTKCDGETQQIIYEGAREFASVDEVVYAVLHDVGIRAETLQSLSAANVVFETESTIEVATPSVNEHGGYTVVVGKTEVGGFFPIGATQCQGTTLRGP